MSLGYFTKWKHEAASLTIEQLNGLIEGIREDVFEMFEAYMTSSQTKQQQMRMNQLHSKKGTTTILPLNLVNHMQDKLNNLISERFGASPDMENHIANFVTFRISSRSSAMIFEKFTGLTPKEFMKLIELEVSPIVLFKILNK